jgi:hypothetical protein
MEFKLDDVARVEIMKDRLSAEKPKFYTLYSR